MVSSTIIVSPPTPAWYTINKLRSAGKEVTFATIKELVSSSWQAARILHIYKRDVVQSVSDNNGKNFYKT